MQKKVLLISLITFLFGCNNSAGNPKEVLQKFLEAMHNNNFAEAKKYATENSQSFLNLISRNKEKSGNIYQQQNFSITNVEIEADHATANVVTSSENTPVTFNLKKESGEWKVEFNFSSIMKMAEDAIKKQGADMQGEFDNAADSIKKYKDTLSKTLEEAGKTLDSALKN